MRLAHEEGDFRATPILRKTRHQDDRDGAADRCEFPQYRGRISCRIPRGGLQRLPPGKRKTGGRSAEGVFNRTEWLGSPAPTITPGVI